MIPSPICLVKTPMRFVTVLAVVSLQLVLPAVSQTPGTTLVDQGKNACSRAIRLNSWYTEAFLLRAANYMVKGDYDHVIEDSSEAIRLEPKRGYGFFLRGQAHGRKGDDDKAIEDYTEAIRLDPKDDESFRNRAWIYEHKGDSKHAMQDYAEAMRLVPKDTDAESLGILYDDQGDHERAIQNFTEAIRLNQNSRAVNFRGIDYYRKGDIDKEEHVIELTPISGPKELIPASLEAVRQWQYKPYIVKGEAVEVETTVTVNFQLQYPEFNERAR